MFTSLLFSVGEGASGAVTDDDGGCLFSFNAPLDFAFAPPCDRPANFGCFSHVLSAVQVSHSVHLLTRVSILPLSHWRYSFSLAE